MKMVVMVMRRSKVEEHVNMSDHTEKDDDISRGERRLGKCSDGDGGDNDVGDCFGAALSIEWLGWSTAVGIMFARIS